MKHGRDRTDRRRGYRHQGAEGDRRPRVVRLSRGESGEVALHLYVHQGGAVTDGALEPPSPTGEAARGALRPSFSGRLFGWEDHYHPIARRMGPKLAEEKQRARRALLTRLGRFGFLAILLTALMAVGCGWW